MLHTGVSRMGSNEVVVRLLRLFGHCEPLNDY